MAKVETDVDVVAVTGTCVEERRSCARRLAAAHGFVLVPAEQTAEGVEVVDRAISLVRMTAHAQGMVLEYPVETPVMEIVGALNAAAANANLIDLVCVLDVGHLLADIASEEYVCLTAMNDGGEGGILAAKAELLVSQIEFASTIAIVNAAGLQPEEFEQAAAVVSHLAPSADQRLITDSDDVHGDVRRPFSERPPDAGWVSILNREFRPQFHSRGVVACRYEQLRPFHPGRLHRALTSCLFQGHCGRIVRSAGFTRLATPPHITGQWDQVGGFFTLSPLTLDHRLGADDEFLAFGQDLAFIGIDIDEPSLRRVLDDAALSDAELAAGPTVWAGFPDRFPDWSTARM